MYIRNCAGGVVFFGDEVFLLLNDKGEWVLPKGLIREGAYSQDVAQQRVWIEAGIKAVVAAKAGETRYEFYSISRKMPVCNQVTWYAMRSASRDFHVDENQGFTGGGWFPYERALNQITYTQDKHLLELAKAALAQ